MIHEDNCHNLPRGLRYPLSLEAILRTHLGNSFTIAQLHNKPSRNKIDTRKRIHVSILTEIKQVSKLIQVDGQTQKIIILCNAPGHAFAR